MSARRARATLGILAGVGAAAGAAAARGDEPAPYTLESLAARRPELERFGVRPFGWVAVGASTTLTPHGDRREARVFDDLADGVQLHQTYLALERALDDERAFDVGGKVAVLAGTDARFLHAVGWLDEQDAEVEVDVLEANLTARFAVGCGLSLKVGRFTTPLGYEVIEETGVALPSRSLLFGYAIPFTHVGGLASWQATPSVKLSYGLVSGWDVGEDPNDAWTQLASCSWASPLGGDSVTVQAIVGPEQPDDDRDLRTVVDAIWAVDLSPRWRLALNADVGVEEDAAVDGDAAWWGGAAYLTWAPTTRAALTVRVEGFRDRDGTRLGRPVTLSELTLGADLLPCAGLPNLHVRPEVRWDHAWDGPFFHGGTERDQVSLSLGALITF